MRGITFRFKPDAHLFCTLPKYWLKQTFCEKDTKYNECSFSSSTICEKAGADSWILTNPKSFVSQQKLWNNYFLVLETLDEKQVHIVKQVLDLKIMFKEFEM